MNILIRYATIVLFIVSLSVSAAAKEITIVAMNSFQPFVFSDANNKAAGIAVDVVTSILEQTDIKTGPITLYPLKRMMTIVLERPNTLGFALFRTPEREHAYKWIVPVTLPIKSVLIRLKSRSNISINTLADAKHYLIGVVDGNNLHAFLKAAGFEKLDPAPTNELNYKKLFAGRIDLFIAREPSVLTEFRQLGYTLDDIVVALQVCDDGPAWLVGNLQTPEDVIAKLKTAYDQIKNEQLIEEVTKDYY